MSVSPYRQNKFCYQFVERIISAHGKEGISYPNLIRECLTKFDVSRGSVEKFINDFYVETGEYMIKDGILIKKR